MPQYYKERTQSSRGVPLLPESAYAFSANSCMLDSMRELDPAIRRGIIDLDENNTSDWAVN